MGNEFIPTLIQTIDYEAYRWHDLQELISDKVAKLIDNNDVDRIYDLIEKGFARHLKPLLKHEIKDFIGDLKDAGGVVAVRSKIYQDVILAILESE